MRKPDTLCDWLLRSLPFLDAHPEKLHLFIEEGRIITVRGETLSYKYSYDLVLVLEDMADDSHALIVPLLAWIAKNQPDLLTGDGLPFTQDILSNAARDIEIRLALTETVVVNATVDGGWDVSYPAAPAFPALFEGSEAARLRQLWLDGGAGPDLVAWSADAAPDQM